MNYILPVTSFPKFNCYTIGYCRSYFLLPTTVNFSTFLWATPPINRPLPC